MNQEKERLIITYHGVEITYHEQKNRWLFTLRGKDRSAETLTNAKSTILAPPPKDEKPFRRFEAWHSTYGAPMNKVTVTSMTETGRFWLTGQDDRGRKSREQTGEYNLYPCNPKNDAVIERLKTKAAEIEKLRTEITAIQKELVHVEPKDWEVSE